MITQAQRSTNNTLCTERFRNFFCLKLKIMNQFLLKCQELISYQNWNDTFFRDILLKSELSYLVLFKKNTKHTATFPTGTIGYFEIPITTVKPSHQKINHLKTLFHSVVPTYYPETTEPINFHYQEIQQQRTIFFEVNHKDLYKDLIHKTIL